MGRRGKPFIKMHICLIVFFAVSPCFAADRPADFYVETTGMSAVGNISREGLEVFMDRDGSFGIRNAFSANALFDTGKRTRTGLSWIGIQHSSQLNRPFNFRKVTYSLGSTVRFNNSIIQADIRRRISTTRSITVDVSCGVKAGIHEVRVSGFDETDMTGRVDDSIVNVYYPLVGAHISGRIGPRVVLRIDYSGLALDYGRYDVVSSDIRTALCFEINRIPDRPDSEQGTLWSLNAGWRDIHLRTITDTHSFSKEWQGLSLGLGARF